ncbi:type III-B CRISPR-associated protein Cas10/Cmr2 [Leptolyngbya sp. CCNP1308]|uniref:Cas10/Cmr2 second palm domain-containing protein n=1 Tax=Leptolyngbya sp. CCNP1308 TaxID=3110255 RepID=UPI002B206A1F|nr:type III-B CRISPR-associated protein Cas10/Cmr2 [Leptolyngbya sp. CCNP1308]MEA5447620.1 type III-B CRISPR-associated protein Cas10/Cmr2 [Leptolyngbya sp. CCNP1308]
MTEEIYTAISFAPVQGFIEKSRKLRDLYGASGLLSYLAERLVEATPANCEVISPASINLQRGMPNRLLIRGDYPRNLVEQTLLQAWQRVLDQCRQWVETRLQDTFPRESYHWQEVWAKWGRYHWEIFWGHGDSIQTAMKDLETRKLRRDWVAVNWVGESSSLSGVDAIAWPGLGALNSNPGWSLSPSERQQMESFYEALAERLSSPNASEEDTVGRFLATNERLSVPELVKRLVTWPQLARELGISELESGFTDIHRNTRDGKGQWTGWFMGDGDHVGDYLQKELTPIGDEAVRDFSRQMREWGQDFSKSLSRDHGRVVYAGGDDFLGVLYGQASDRPLATSQALDWLMGLNAQWQQHGHPITVSVGFVWVSPNVPQRDVLQHCRLAQKRAKNLGRDRVTIRIVFNSGQFVEWTCRWQDLDVLQSYCDRNGTSWGNNPNWAHIFTDWAQLKARHAIPSRQNPTAGDDTIAIEFFDLYFPGYGQTLFDQAADILGPKNDPLAMIDWINGAIHTGWYLAANQG